MDGRRAVLRVLKPEWLRQVVLRPLSQPTALPHPDPLRPLLEQEWRSPCVRPWRIRPQCPRTLPTSELHVAAGPQSLACSSIPCARSLSEPRATAHSAASRAWINARAERASLAGGIQPPRLLSSESGDSGVTTDPSETVNSPEDQGAQAGNQAAEESVGAAAEFLESQEAAAADLGFQEPRGSEEGSAGGGLEVAGGDLAPGEGDDIDGSLEVSDDEAGDEELEELLRGTDLLGPQGTGMAGAPKRVQRFMIQKLLKVKPMEPVSMAGLRKKFQMRIVDVNRTTKVTKGGKLISFGALVVCGNGMGVVGFGRGKSAEVGAAVDKAFARSLRNLHYFERFRGRTVARAQLAKYGKTKVYLWPAKKGSSMSAGPTVGGILRLAGFTAVKTKVHGSRNPINTVKATFKALGLIDSAPSESSAAI